MRKEEYKSQNTCNKILYLKKLSSINQNFLIFINVNFIVGIIEVSIDNIMNLKDKKIKKKF